MTNNWKPGDVAVAQYRDEPASRYFYRKVFGKDGAYEWVNEDGTRSERFELAEWHRPLVVIDPDDREQVERLVRAMPPEWNLEQPDDPELLDDSVAGVTTALRSLLAPPRPEEPTGLGAVVEDDRGRQWVRGFQEDDAPWVCDHFVSRSFSDIPNPVRVLSEGVAR